LIENKEHIINESDSFDFKRLFHQIVKNWYFFVVSVFLGLIAAYLVIQYSSPKYQVSANILVQDEQNPVQRELLEMSNLTSGSGKVDNELGILKSRSLMKHTIERMDYDVFYYKNTRFGYREIYRDAPFEIDLVKLNHYVVNTKCNLHYLSPNQVLLQASVKKALVFSPMVERIVEQTEDYKYIDTVNVGDTVAGTFGTFIIQPNLFNFMPEKLKQQYAFQFNTDNYLKGTFNQLSFSPKQNSSIITARLAGENPERLVEFLNTYLQLYLQKGVQKKNRVAHATIQFINEQLEQVSDSLSISEDELEAFQSENKLLNIDFQAQQMYGNIESLHQEKQKINLRLEYYSYLKKYIQNNETPKDVVAPSSMNFHEPLLSSLILQLTELSAERKEMMYNTKKTNPYLATINRKIEDVKHALIENLESSIQTSSMTLEQINTQIAQTSSEFTELPSEQRRLLSMKRDFELNNELYNFLLKKRSEMQIARASNLPSNEIIDNASLDAVIKIAPNTRQIYMVALVLALFLPGAIIYLRDVLNNKISERDDISKITNYPVIGQIFHHKLQTENIFKDQPTSQITDSFRSIRTNFQFFEKKNKANIIQITSSLTKEGKSFVSLNLAQAFATNKRKTILLDFDLRKARIKDYADLKSNKGLSLFLSEHGQVRDMIEKTDNPYLDIIPAGPIPPNPTELVESDKTAELMEYLRQHYQYIFLDTPPISSISDAYILTKYADINLFVVRNNYTPKKLFESVIRDIELRKIPVHLIINDIQIQSGRYYGYYRPYRYEAKPKSFTQNVKNVIFSNN
jgi:capsular exopolysaccharide synthesis family protein